MSKTLPERKIFVVSENSNIDEIQGVVDCNNDLRRNSSLTKIENLYTYEFNIKKPHMLIQVSRCIATVIYSRCVSKMLSMFLESNEMSLLDNKFELAQIALFDAMQQHFVTTMPLLSYRIENHFETKDRLNLDVYLKVNTKKIVEDGYNHISTNMNLNFYLMDMIFRIKSIDDNSDDASFLYASLLSRSIYFRDRDFIFDDSEPTYVYFERGHLVFGDEEIAFPMDRKFLEETIGRRYGIESLSPAQMIALAVVLMNVSVVRIHSSVSKSVINQFKKYVENNANFFNGYKIEYTNGDKPNMEVDY